MKGTLKEITGKKTGLIIYPDAKFPQKVFKASWKDNPVIYKEKKGVKYIDDCSDWFRLRPDLNYESYYTYNNIFMSGYLYFFDNFIILCPTCWE